jgi:FdhD protein
MGVDKTLLSLDGRTLVARVCDAVAEVCSATVIATNRPEALEGAGVPDGVRVVRDEVAYQGPLGGLVSAMAVAETEWVLAVAADMPHLEPAVIRALWAVRGDADVVVPSTEKGPEPLLALYRVAACLEPARAVLATGRRRLVAIFPQVAVVEVPIEVLRSADPDLRSLMNVNTPADLADAREAVPERESRRRRLEVVEVATRRTRTMPSELPVTIHLNDTEIATVQATPRDLEELAIGFLLAEGFLSDRSKFRGADTDAKRGLVWVSSAEEAPDDLAQRARYLTSGCGKGVTFASVGHARGLAPVDSDFSVSADEIYSLVRELADAATMYRDSGGMHAAGLGRAGELLVAREDVGRHNAIDKVLGRAWLDGIATEDAVLVATGRISYEMAVKAGKARVPVAASRSAVTDLAADLADGLGIALVGYVRGGKLTVYTHAERVRTDDSEEGGS